MRETYGQQYDSCAGDLDSPYVSDDMAHLSAFDPQARWVSGGGGGGGSGGYRAGDVVLFQKFTIHGSAENSSADYVRLSSDVRFQPASEPVDYRHTATPAREMAAEEGQDEDYMRAMHRRFDQLKASTYDGPLRTMTEALQQWGVVPQARSAAAAAAGAATKPSL